MSLDLDVVMFDFDTAVSDESREAAVCAFQLLLLDERLCRARVGYLQALGDAASRRGMPPRQDDGDSFGPEIRAIGEHGVAAAILSGRLAASRLARLARSPSALWQAHQAWRLADESFQDSDIAVLPPGVRTLMVGGQALQVSTMEDCAVSVAAPRSAGPDRIAFNAEIRFEGDAPVNAEVYVEYVFTSQSGEVSAGCAFPHAAAPDSLVDVEHSGAAHVELQLPRPAAAGRFQIRAFARRFQGGRTALPSVGHAPQQLSLDAESPPPIRFEVPHATTPVPVGFGEAVLEWPG